jgi:hypothetical protein
MWRCSDFDGVIAFAPIESGVAVAVGQTDGPVEDVDDASPRVDDVPRRALLHSPFYNAEMIIIPEWVADEP